MPPFYLAATTLPLADPLAFVDTAARAGCAGIGLRLYQPSGAPAPFVTDPARVRDVKSAVSASGMSVLDVFSCYLRSEVDFEGLRPALDCGAELGARYALAICADMEWPRLVDNLGRLCALASEFGITPALEAPLQDRVIPTVERTLALVDETGGEAVVCLDTYQLFRTAESAAVVRTRPQLFPYVQVADGLLSPVGTRLPGEGAVPLREMVAELPEELPLSLECVPPTDSAWDPLEWTTTVLTSARRALI
jgi:sugar phosphate isomerase/epimerase